MGLRKGGGNCLKYLKMWWNRKEHRGNKDFKKGGKLGQGVGALKRRGNSLFQFALFYFYFVTNLPKKNMAYIPVQLNLPPSSTSQYAFNWPPPSTPLEAYVLYG